MPKPAPRSKTERSLKERMRLEIKTLAEIDAWRPPHRSVP